MIQSRRPAGPESRAVTLSRIRARRSAKPRKSNAASNTSLMSLPSARAMLSPADRDRRDQVLLVGDGDRDRADPLGGGGRYRGTAQADHRLAAVRAVQLDVSRRYALEKPDSQHLEYGLLVGAPPGHE